MAKHILCIAILHQQASPLADVIDQLAGFVPTAAQVRRQPLAQVAFADVGGAFKRGAAGVSAAVAEDARR